MSDGAGGTITIELAMACLQFVGAIAACICAGSAALSLLYGPSRPVPPGRLRALHTLLEFRLAVCECMLAILAAFALTVSLLPVEPEPFQRAIRSTSGVILLILVATWPLLFLACMRRMYVAARRLERVLRTRGAIEANRDSR